MPATARTLFAAIFINLHARHVRAFPKHDRTFLGMPLLGYKGHLRQTDGHSRLGLWKEQVVVGRDLWPLLLGLVFHADALMQRDIGAQLNPAVFIKDQYLARKQRRAIVPDLLFRIPVCGSL